MSYRCCTMPLDDRRWDYVSLSRRMALLRQESIRVRSHSHPSEKILRNMLIVQMSKDGISVAEIAEAYGISRTRVAQIVRHKR
jgi:Homeodomain-like domain